jgi:adenosylcobyric acid synthase
VVRLPHISNFSDFTALDRLPGVEVFYSQTPRDLPPADVVILPGSKNTISDLEWLRAVGWTEAIIEHAKSGKPIIGICGGFQMLGREVRDPFHLESERDSAPGLNLLDVTTSLRDEKVTRQANARLISTEVISTMGDEPIFEGYEIHMGETILGAGAQPFLSLTRLGDAEPIADGAISKDGRVMGTYLHGLFDSSEGASIIVSHLRRVCGKPHNSDMTNATIDRDRHYEELAAHFRRHLDVEAIYRLVGAAQLIEKWLRVSRSRLYEKG